MKYALPNFQKVWQNRGNHYLILKKVDAMIVCVEIIITRT